MVAVNSSVSPASSTTGRWLFAIATVLGFALYCFTAMPGVGWQDCALFQYRVWRMDLPGELGLALAHPLYVLLAKGMTWLPVGNFAYRVNLFSAVCGALTLGASTALLWRLTASVLAAAVGTIVLAVSHTFWLHAVLAEVYDLYALLLVVELLLVTIFIERRQSKWLILALLVNGLNVSVHDLALLHAPAYLGLIVWAWRQQIVRLKDVLIGATAFLMGSALYISLIVIAIANGQPILSAIKESLLGRYYGWAVLATQFSVVEQIKRTLLYFALNFPTPLLLLAPCGAYWGWKNSSLRWFVLFAGSIFAIDFVFAFRYLVADAYKFFTPDYVIFALFIGIAVPHLGKPSAAKGVVLCLLALLPIGVYEVAPSMLQRAGVSLGVSRAIPLRNNYAYFIRPRKNGNDGAEKFARVALGQAAPEGVLITDADTNIKNVLTYVRDAEGIEPKVVLTVGPDINGLPPLIETTPESIRGYVQRGQAYVCSDNPRYVLNWILKKYDLEPVGEPKGVVYRLKAR